MKKELELLVKAFNNEDIEEELQGIVYRSEYKSEIDYVLDDLGIECYDGTYETKFDDEYLKEGGEFVKPRWN